MSRVTFNTDAYEASHGRRPRGSGTWAFGFNSRNPGLDAIHWVQGSLSYSAAKAEAKAEALRRYPHASSITIYPLP